MISGGTTAAIASTTKLNPDDAPVAQNSMSVKATQETARTTRVLCEDINRTRRIPGYPQGQDNSTGERLLA